MVLVCVVVSVIVCSLLFGDDFVAVDVECSGFWSGGECVVSGPFDAPACCGDGEAPALVVDESDAAAADGEVAVFIGVDVEAAGG